MHGSTGAPDVNYHDRRFRSIANSATGDVGDATVFHYRQHDRIVWATYEGGAVVFGTLVATILDDGRLDMRYQHVAAGGTIKTGRCLSTPEQLPDGRLRLDETWTWTEGGAGQGQSQVEELPGMTVEEIPA